MESRQTRLIELIQDLLRTGWNQTSLSKAIGVSQPTIWRWLSGKSVPEPGSHNFQRLAQATGGTKEALLLYLDNKISLDEYRSTQNRTTEQIKADILRLEPTEIAALIAFSAEVIVQKSPYPMTSSSSTAASTDPHFDLMHQAESLSN